MRISDWSSDVCSSDLYLDAMRAKIAAVTARLGELTNHVPGAEVVVKPVEPWLEASAGTAGYFAPSADGSRPGILYVNTRNMRNLPIYERSEERRVGKECVSTCRSRWSPYHSHKTIIKRQ